MPAPRYWLTRAGNGLRRVAAGLRPRGESVWPGVHNDLFVAHASIYTFFARFVAGKRVLDAACGTGYGAAMLADAGAAWVVGVDLDRLSVRYATRHFARPNLEFQVADCEHLNFPPGGFDLIVSSNTLEHLKQPEGFLVSGHRLADDPTMVVAVPPITGSETLATHQAIRYHRSNLTVREWLALFELTGWRAQAYRHVFRGAAAGLDFASPYRSLVRTSEFDFVLCDLDGLCTEPSITAIFVLRPSPIAATMGSCTRRAHD